MSAVNSTTGSSSNTAAKRNGYDLKTEDFIKMMITQLQNQDPMEPAKNGELLAQMSQIGTLQSSTTLHSSLKTMVMQNQVASAGNMIGKMIEGSDSFGEKVTGLVNSVRVTDDQVMLELDNGKEVALDKVTHIAQAENTATAIGGDGLKMPMAS